MGRHSAPGKVVNIKLAKAQSPLFKIISQAAGSLIKAKDNKQVDLNSL